MPLAGLATNPEHLAQLEAWMKSYRPEELFDERGAVRAEITALAPDGDRRMGANPHANGGLLLRDLDLPDFRDYAVDVPTPRRSARWRDTHVLGDVAARRDAPRTPTGSASWDPTRPRRTGCRPSSRPRTASWMAERLPGDDHLAPDGRVMEVLSEHLCEGWLEGYLLTGRHGLFNSYEAFIHIVDSMFNQHAKWLKESRETPWRLPIASLNYLLSSHVWRQDHNGFSHQDPGFIDLVVNKKAEIVRVYFPPDANCLLSVADHCLRSRDYVNVVVAGKQPQPAWLTMAEALQHCALGIGEWEWASTNAGGEADVVLACVGDVPTLETLAAAAMLREHLPSLRVTRGQRRRPDAAGAAVRAPARAARRRLRRALPASVRRWSSPTTATRRSSTNSPTSAPTTTTSTCTGTATRARPPRRSTWSCSTTSTASVSSSTSSTACPVSRDDRGAKSGR